MSRNLTLAVDDEVLAKYRVLAAKRKTSVNAMIRQHMEEAVGLAARREAAREWMLRKAEENMARDAANTQSGSDDREGWRWNREEIYSGPRFDWPRER